MWLTLPIGALTAVPEPVLFLQGVLYLQQLSPLQ